MSKFAITKYVYTQDPSDDRGIAWTKYVLDYIINGDAATGDIAGDGLSVQNRKNNVWARVIPEKNNTTVGNLFSGNIEADQVGANFMDEWFRYLGAISSGNLANNEYARRLYNELLGNNYKNLDPNIKKILSSIFYIGQAGQDPFSADPYAVDRFYSISTLGRLMNANDLANNQIIVNADLVLFRQADANALKTFRTKDPVVVIADYENELDKSEIKYKVWPNLSPDVYISKLFDKLNDMDIATQKYQKYYSNGPDREYDFIKNNLWERVVDERNNTNYRKEGKELNIDQAMTGNEANCYNLGITDAAVCDSFMQAIFEVDANESIRKLSDFIRNNKNALNEIKGSINNVHPELALTILKRFGFKVNKKNEIISVGLWLKNYMSQHFTSNELEVLIKKNYKLLDFLDYLVRFINYNPRILDPNAIKIHSPGSMDKYYSINTNMKELENTLKYYKTNKILRIGNNISSTNFNPMIFGQLAGANFTDNVMMGGGAVSTGEGISQQDTHGYNLMKMYFNNVKSELAKYGKQLDENDNKFIERQIDNLKYYEDIVYNNLKTITEYVNRKTGDDEVVLGEKEIKQYTNLNKFNLAKENYNLQGDQVINALLMAIDKLKPYENGNKVNEAPIPLN